MRKKLLEATRSICFDGMVLHLNFYNPENNKSILKFLVVVVNI